RSILGAYVKYLDHTPTFTIGLSLVGNDHDSVKRNSDLICNSVKNAGILSISRNFRSHTGIVKTLADEKSSSVISLQSLAINLPRLAYQSNKDETYFRARLALMIKPALAALYIRKKAVAELIRKGTVPALSGNSDFIQSGTTNIIINLIGARESVNDILGH